MNAETVPCPGCAAPMGLLQEVCGACRRPRDEAEIESGRELAREHARKLRRLPLTAASWVLAIAASALALRHRGLVLAYVSAFRSEVRLESNAIEETAPLPAGTVPKTAARAAEIAALGGPPSRPAAAPAPTAAPASIAALPVQPNPPPAGSRRLYGIVYDLKSLLVVPRARVRLIQGASGATRSEVETDDEGRYRMDFPTIDDPDFLVAASAPGYMNGQLEDPESPYLHRTLEDRLGVIAETNPEDLGPVPVQFRSEDVFVPLDLVLLPEAPQVRAP
jgi:hypothetical protein